MSQPVCIKCKKKMKLRNGMIFLEYADQMMARPYQLWNADVVTCEQCGSQVVFRFASRPYAQHFEKDFELRVQQAREGAAEGRFILAEACL